MRNSDTKTYIYTFCIFTGLHNSMNISGNLCGKLGGKCEKLSKYAILNYSHTMNIAELCKSTFCRKMPADFFGRHFLVHYLFKFIVKFIRNWCKVEKLVK